jgi:hypothetical protein
VQIVFKLYVCGVTRRVGHCRHASDSIETKLPIQIEENYNLYSC